ncbi:MAG: hypothetical protein ABEJ99_04340, partial [Candidatus Nanohaloarchaea archaeon]
IVLQPTGDVGIDANLSMTGDIDLGGNSLKNIGGLQNCGSNEFVNGNGNCVADSNSNDGTDSDTDSEDQLLGYTSDGTSSGGAVTDTITIDDGAGTQIDSISFDDDYEANSMRSENDVESYVFDTGDNDQGNLGLNGSNIVDNSGPITLGGGNVEVPSGDLLMNNNTISGVGPAQDPFDAVNKSYVDQNDDTVNDNQNLKDVLSHGGSTGGFDVSIDSSNITSGSGNITFERSIKVYGEVWAAGTGSGGGGGSSSGLPEILSNNNTAGSNSLNMFGNEISNVGRVVIEHSTNDFLKLRGAGKAPHTLRFDDRDLRIWSGDGVGTVMRFYNETGKVEIPNGDLDMSGNNITDSTRGNVSVGDSLFVYGNVYGTGADLAEIYPSDQELKPGQLVTTSGAGKVERTDARFEKTVGVVSRDPGYVMNSIAEGYEIGLEGKIEVRLKEGVEVDGGENIVASTVAGKATSCKMKDEAEAKTFEELKQITKHNRMCEDNAVGIALENASKQEDGVEVLVN